MNNKLTRNLITGKNSNKPKSILGDDSFFTALFKNEYIIVMLLFGIMIVFGVIVLLFENTVPHIRTEFISNFMGFFLAIFIMYLLFYTLSKKFTIFGVSFDISMIYYIMIILMLMLLFIR
jgi:hypothetical protein